MAIALDTTATHVTGTSPYTFSYTTSGSDRILFLVVTVNSGTVSSVTYNAVSMTEVTHVTEGGGQTTYMFYLVNPALGANNVVITSTTGPMYGVSLASYTGASQTGQPDASGTTAASIGATSYTTTLTTIASNCWLISTSRTNAGLTLTAGANTVVRQQPENTYLGSGGLWDSGGARSAGSNSLIVTSSSQDFEGGITASFAPVPPTTSIKSINGLAYASIKSVNGLAIASVKSWNGLA